MKMFWGKEKICLNATRQRKYLLAVFTCFGIIISALILTFGIFIPEINTYMLFAVTVVASGFMAGLWICEYRRSLMARLIIENQILRICPVAISDSAGDAKNIEVFISYFGILLDTKIIKFNQDGILLKAVEIGRDFISLTYGTEKKMKSSWLLCTMIDKEELDRIVERFRYETGVMPVIIK